MSARTLLLLPALAGAISLAACDKTTGPKLPPVDCGDTLPEAWAGRYAVEISFYDCDTGEPQITVQDTVDFCAGTSIVEPLVEEGYMVTECGVTLQEDAYTMSFRAERSAEGCKQVVEVSGDATFDGDHYTGSSTVTQTWEGSCGNGSSCSTQTVSGTRIGPAVCDSN